jgi:hypothetical protein
MERSAFSFCGRSLLVELEAEVELFDGAVDGRDGFDAMTAEVVGGVFEMVFGAVERIEGGTNFRVWFGRSGWSDCRIGEAQREGPQ